jgi:AcrR family transcriptional regulator
VPKATYFNLKESKRIAIEEAATREFGTYGFYGARLNRIVARAGIAKGSFYQYFDHLEDLYFHLSELYVNQKLALIYEVLSKHDEADFFTKYRLICKASVSFTKSVSDDVLLMSEQMGPDHHRDADPRDRFRRRKEEELFKPLIAKAIDQGEINSDADLAFVVVTNITSMIQQYLSRPGSVYGVGDLLRKPHELEHAIDVFINFLKSGLAGQFKDMEH